MTYRRGDVVVCVLPGNLGKPRPAVVVQSDAFNETHASVTVCPITSHVLGDAPLFRVPVPAGHGSGLKVNSEVMADKVQTPDRKRVGKQIGRLAPQTMTSVDEALRRWFDLGVQ